MRWLSLPPRLTLLLAAGLALGACDVGDAGGPSPSASFTAKTAMTPSRESPPFQITNSARVWSEGETVVLEVDGQRIEVSAGEGYVISQALGRASFDALDEGVKKQFPGYEPGAEEEGHPQIGDGGIVHEGIIFGPGRRPPLPPMPDWDPGFLEQLLMGSAEVVEIPKGTDFSQASGGWVSH